MKLILGLVAGLIIGGASHLGAGSQDVCDDLYYMLSSVPTEVSILSMKVDDIDTKLGRLCDEVGLSRRCR